MPHEPSDSMPLSLDMPSQATRSDASCKDEVVQLFEQLRQPLLRYLRTFGISLQDSEEAVQETFLALFRHLQRGKPRTNLHGWLFTVAHRLGQKRRQLQARHEGLDSIEWPDPTPSQEANMAGEQTREQVRALIRALPEQDQQCLYLRGEGLRYRQISEVLGISLGSVAASLSRSLTKIARITKSK